MRAGGSDPEYQPEPPGRVGCQANHGHLVVGEQFIHRRILSRPDPVGRHLSRAGVDVADRHNASPAARYAGTCRRRATLA